MRNIDAFAANGAAYRIILVMPLRVFSCNSGLLF